MTFKRNTLAAGIVLLAVATTGCQGVKEQMGVGRHSPDEFSVVKRAPLTMPPDYALRAPATTAAPPATQASAQAKTIVLGTPGGVAAESGGSAEQQLLSKMGADKADPNIRDTIAEENGYIALDNQKVIDKLIFWQDPNTDETNIPGSEVDPKKEAERIKANKASGAAVTEGETPVIEKKQGAIDKIF